MRVQVSKPSMRASIELGASLCMSLRVLGMSFCVSLPQSIAFHLFELMLVNRHPLCLFNLLKVESLVCVVLLYSQHLLLLRIDLAVRSTCNSADQNSCGRQQHISVLKTRSSHPIFWLSRLVLARKSGMAKTTLDRNVQKLFCMTRNPGSTRISEERV